MTERERRDAGASTEQRQQETGAAVPKARTSADTRAEPTATAAAAAPGRADWSMFAGTLLVVLAGLQLIWGLAGLLRTTMFLVASTGLGITWNYTVWSWIFIGMAVLTGLTGLAVLGRVAPARYAGIFLASVLVFANFLTLPAMPIWSLIMIGVGILAIYALAARGSEFSTGGTAGARR